MKYFWGTLKWAALLLLGLYLVNKYGQEAVLLWGAAIYFVWHFSKELERLQKRVAYLEENTVRRQEPTADSGY